MPGGRLQRLTGPVLLAAGLALAACDGSTTGATPAPAVPVATATAAPTLAQLCVKHVEYWAGEKIAHRPDQGFDYQEMGLVAGEYRILADLVAAHQAAQPGVTTLTDRERQTVVSQCDAAYGPTARTLPSASGHAWPSG